MGEQEVTQVVGTHLVLMALGCAVCSVQCAVCSVKCAMCSVYIVQFADADISWDIDIVNILKSKGCLASDIPDITTQL